MMEARPSAGSGADAETVSVLMAEPAGRTDSRQASDARGGSRSEPGSFLQSEFWALFKQRTGWKSDFVEIEMGSRRLGRVSVLSRSLGLGLWFSYVPHGPEAAPDGIQPERYLEAVGNEIAKRIAPRPSFVRFDLPWPADREDGASLLSSLQARSCRLRRGAAVQAPDTILLPLEDSLDSILAAMKPKWRYNIRLAEKKGVQVVREGRSGLERFYALYTETSRRDGLAIHPLEYYKTLFSTYEERNRLRTDQGIDLSLWFAKYEGEDLAAIITLSTPDVATYLYGASSSRHRNLMPAYALQWHAIQDAKRRGCKEYDFFGIPPDDSKDHPLAGLLQFKSGFGGRVLHRAGSVDLPVDRLAYSAFRLAERARGEWLGALKKRAARNRRDHSSSPNT